MKDELTERKAIEILLDYYKREGDKADLQNYLFNCPLCSLFNDTGNLSEAEDYCTKCPWVKFEGYICINRYEYIQGNKWREERNWKSWYRKSIERLERWLKLLDEEEKIDGK